MKINAFDGSTFKGKTVTFGTADDNLAIKNISFEEQFGRIFVVGEIPRGTTNNDWAMGRPCAIAWDSITDYIIFDSEDSYAASLENS